MDAFPNLSRPISLQSLLKSNDISATTAKYVAKVYTTLAAGVGMAAAGALFLPHIAGITVLLASLAAAAAVLMSSPQRGMFSLSESTRWGLLYAFFGMQGISLAPFLYELAAVDPAIITLALLASASVFACFSLAAMLTTRRTVMYGFSILGSMMSILSMFSFIGWAWGGRLGAMAFNVNLYGGLAMFIGYVMMDTQMMIAAAEAGAKDVPKDALQLFVDFAGIFVRIAVILARNKQRESKSSRNSRR